MRLTVSITPRGVCTILVTVGTPTPREDQAPLPSQQVRMPLFDVPPPAPREPAEPSRLPPRALRAVKLCYVCGQAGHRARRCSERKA